MPQCMGLITSSSNSEGQAREDIHPASSMISVLYVCMCMYLQEWAKDWP
jgi:hypothetical protein